MSNYLTINHYKPEHRHLRKKIKKWVKRGWAEMSWYGTDEYVYKMIMFYYITEDNKLKVDYQKLARVSTIVGERKPHHTIEGKQ